MIGFVKTNVFAMSLGWPLNYSSCREFGWRNVVRYNLIWIFIYVWEYRIVWTQFYFGFCNIFEGLFVLVCIYEKKIRKTLTLKMYILVIQNTANRLVIKINLNLIKILSVELFLKQYKQTSGLILPILKVVKKLVKIKSAITHSQLT